MEGAAQAALHAGWESEWRADGCLARDETADVVLLPWPHSFRQERLTVMPPHEGAAREDVLVRIPPCRLLMHGSGVKAEDVPQASDALDPGRDEPFLLANAALTAEGAICRAMQRMERALMGCACLITGYGRIGRALCERLCAMGAFVIVCARSEGQMQAAHAAGAHPVPLAQLPGAAKAADLILNTVPARVLNGEVLRAVRPDTLVLELASAPYGADLDAARALGVRVEVESGVPGRYAPLDAGAALFEAALRRLNGEGERHG